ncbi:tripartite tricarboxylate transporter substrate binding protein [Roseomonas sp. PWR1]|uniref:Tripartite tricarboxylate transporter substrate binding protein n=1 Tax=Roseomonas nitratireducens TaxID=2820810 RepID=A0ABS4AZ64_9PROT|nr:tripartite tricarboxylate transporter substrate binding protein [Neoroseomonas nitratireducens]MBP0466670.1 tripartite tricarboxylate transporter substrate binding protein [Neoroseomonas nitratireducens]
MKIQRRVLATGLLALPAIARAQGAWQPSRPVQLIAGFAPGGGSDIIARTIAEAAAPLYPVPLVVINRPGAGGALAAEQVARMPPDGHALLLAGGSESTSVPAHREVPYDPKRSFRAVIRLTRHGQFLVVKGRGGKFADVNALMAAARQAPEAVSHASAGVGTLTHSIFLLLGRAAGAQFLHVPFTGGGPSMQAIVAGQVDCGVAAPEEMAGLVDSGDLKVLAIASPERAPAYPDVPTFRELGWNVVAENMKGWVGPAGLTDEIAAYHHQRMRQAMAAPQWQRFMERSREPDGYADGPGFQQAMDNLLDSIRSALRG